MGEGVELAVSQAFFLQTYMQKFRWFTSSSGLEACYHFKTLSSENLFFSKGDYSKVRCHPPKALDKAAFLQSKGVVGYNKKKN